MILFDANSKRVANQLIQNLKQNKIIVLHDDESIYNFNQSTLRPNNISIEKFVPWPVYDLTVKDEIIIICITDINERKKAFEFVLSKTENEIYFSNQFYSYFGDSNLSDTYFFENKTEVNTAKTFFYHEKISYNIFTNFIFSYVKKFGLQIWECLPSHEKFLDESIPNYDHFFQNTIIFSCQNSLIIENAINRKMFKKCLIIESNLENYLNLRRKYINFSYFPLEILNFNLSCDNYLNAHSYEGRPLDYDISAGNHNHFGLINLDKLPLQFYPTYIIIDSYNCLNVLNGSLSIIANKYYSPAIAIAVDYCPSIIWNIPKFISSKNNRYRFYLRNYSGYVKDTILYAIPEIM